MSNSFRNTATTKIQSGTRYAYREISEGGPVGILILILLAVLIGLFCKVIAVNVVPYLLLFGDPIPAPSKIFVIGWAVDVLNLFINGSAAMLAWAILNGAQCLGILLSFDTKAHRSVLSQMTAEKKFQDMEGGTDSRSINKMRRKALKLPAALFTYSSAIMVVAYIAESLINFKAYPFVNDFPRFFMSLAMGRMEIFNLDNIVKFVWGMASTEIFVIAIVVVVLWMKSYRTNNAPPMVD